MPVSTDPIILILTAVALWAFWLACAVRDRKTDRGAGPRTDTMPSLAAVGAVGLPATPRQPYCGLCGGAHDYDDCPLNEDDAA